VEIAEWHADHAEAARIARDYWSRVLSGEASPA
jgi:hypothetical protein